MISFRKKDAVASFAIVFVLVLCSTILTSCFGGDAPLLPKDELVSVSSHEAETQLQHDFSEKFTNEGLDEIISIEEYSVGDVPSARYYEAKISLKDDWVENHRDTNLTELKAIVFAFDGSSPYRIQNFDTDHKILSIEWSNASWEKSFKILSEKCYNCF